MKNIIWYIIVALLVVIAVAGDIYMVKSTNSVETLNTKILQ